MKFPISFFCANPFDGLHNTLRLPETFFGWFSGWIGISQSLEQTEDFAGYFDAVFNAATENLELSEDFNLLVKKYEFC